MSPLLPPLVAPTQSPASHRTAGPSAAPSHRPNSTLNALPTTSLCNACRQGSRGSCRHPPSGLCFATAGQSGACPYPLVSCANDPFAGLGIEPPANDPITAKCTQLIPGWTDRDGDGCRAYVRHGWCGNGGYGPSWGGGEGSTFRTFAVDGFDAGLVCCDCGGGRVTGTPVYSNQKNPYTQMPPPPPTPPTPPPTLTAHGPQETGTSFVQTPEEKSS